MLQYFDILKEKYDQEKFQKFSLELFNNASLSLKKLEIDQHFTPHIESLTYLGAYEDPQGKKLHILDVNLKTQVKLEQARTMQRNLIAKYLKDHWLDSALVAFHTDSSDSWRLSFVKVEYRFDEQGKTKEEVTPAKRYSFLVGEGEPTHTAQTQLAKIYQQTTINPTLAQLEEAFGIEKVTKEFFAKYRELFESVLAELKSNHTFQNEAVQNNIDTPSFAKKLLGQIVFLYFLQKKGWLGVPKGKSWGEGDRSFLGNLFRQAKSKGENFFNNYLEVLFYDTLNNPRRNEVDPSYSRHFDSKVPFLNGGLFEPQYDWKNSFMYLDNKVFEKILGVFDQYNFTVKEDEPLEKEVAVDPEMLGKVFENLLEENLRKGKGTYYTPREIVHYMCEESLVNYLATEMDSTSDDVRKKYFPTYNVLGDEKFEARDVNISEKIIESLEKIKVVDPACGSGAFLVGMLQQITHLRYELESRSKLLGKRTRASTEYEIKKQTIQNCIYGVDIDPGAIDIAKLRLWLSLVVEYDLEEIEPLPNLDYKIMVGNSLIEKLDANFLVRGIDAKKNELIAELKDLKFQYFESSDPKMKSELRTRINELIRLLINYDNEKERERIWAQILGRKNQMKMFAFDDEQQSFGDVQTFTKKLDQLADIKETDHFEWRLNFNEVFEEGGFGVVIANPPYDVLNKTEGHKISESELSQLRKKELYKPALGGKLNLFRLFIALGISLNRKSGITTMIIPYAFMGDRTSKGIRDYCLDNTELIYIEAFPERDNEKIRVFESVKMSTCIFCLRNSQSFNKFRVRTHYAREIKNDVPTVWLSKEDIFQLDSSNHAIPLIDEKDFVILEKIVNPQNTIPLLQIGKCYEGEVNLTFHKKYLTSDDTRSRMIKGAQIDRYKVNEEMSQGEIEYLKEDQYLKANHGDKSSHHLKPRIVMQGITGVNECTRLKMTTIPGQVYCGNSLNYILINDAKYDTKYLLAILNSSLMNWYFKKFSTNSNVNGYEVDNLPILVGNNELRTKLSELVELRLKLGNEGDGNIEDIAELESNINDLVREGYGISQEEYKLMLSEK